MQPIFCDVCNVVSLETRAHYYFLAKRPLESFALAYRSVLRNPRVKIPLKDWLRAAGATIADSAPTKTSRSTKVAPPPMRFRNESGSSSSKCEMVEGSLGFHSMPPAEEECIVVVDDVVVDDVVVDDVVVDDVVVDDVVVDDVVVDSSPVRSNDCSVGRYKP